MLAEAFSAGVPVVAFPTGGIPELVIDQRNRLSRPRSLGRIAGGAHPRNHSHGPAGASNRRGQCPREVGASLYGRRLPAAHHGSDGETGRGFPSRTRNSSPAPAQMIAAPVSTGGYPKRASRMPAAAAAIACPAIGHQEIQSRRAVAFPSGDAVHQKCEHARFAHILGRHEEAVDQRRANRPGNRRQPNQCQRRRELHSSDQRVSPNLRNTGGASRIAPTCATCDHEKT